MGDEPPAAPSPRDSPRGSGPACDRDGNLYAVNYARQHVGRVTPATDRPSSSSCPRAARTWQPLRPPRPDADRHYTGHNILRVDLATKAIRPSPTSPPSTSRTTSRSAPTILYASDPNWQASTGQIGASARTARRRASKAAWERRTASGQRRREDALRTSRCSATSGPTTWRRAAQVSRKRLLISSRLRHGRDALRRGEPHITRHGKGTILPAGQVLLESPSAPEPSNIAFGDDGRT